MYRQLDTEQMILRLDVGEKIASALPVCEGSGLTILEYQKSICVYAFGLPGISAYSDKTEQNVVISLPDRNITITSSTETHQSSRRASSVQITKQKQTQTLSHPYLCNDCHHCTNR